MALCHGVVPGAKARVQSERSPLESKEGKWHLPTAQGLAADTRMFFLACPIHTIFLARLSHKLLKDFPENLPD